MLQLIEANWIAFVLALLIGMLVAYWLYARGSTIARPRERRPDALDEGAEPARRNQALIDAPPAADLTPPMAAGTMAGIAEIIAVAAQDEVEEGAVRKARAGEEASQAREASAKREPAAPAPAAAAAPPAAAVTGEGDDLRRLKGVGPKLVTVLHSLGVTRFEQIAAWSEADIERIDGQLGAFAGRVRRDSWVEQARLLAAGDTAGYEAKFGKL